MGGSLYLKPVGADTFKLYEHKAADPATLGNSIVVDIVEDSQGNIWVRTNAGLSKIDAEKNIINYDIPRPITEFHLRYAEDMIIDKNDIIWMGWNNEIIKFNTSTTKIDYFVPTNLQLDLGFISSVCEHDDNHLWLGSWGAVYLYDKQQNTAQPYYNDPLRLESLPLANNEALCKDNTGVLWCSGLAKLNLVNKNIRQITSQSVGMRVQDNYIRNLFVDSKGKYWVVTNLGIDIIDKYFETTSSYQVNPDDSTYFLTGYTSVIQEDNQGNIWMCQWGQGIVVLRNGNPGDFYRIKAQPGVADALQNGNIQAMLQDKNGFMWIGTDNGVSIMDVNTKKTRTFYHSWEDLNTPTPWSVEPKSIGEDAQGHIWIGTWGGLTQAKILNPELGVMNSEYQFSQHYNQPGNANTISDNRTVSILCDNKFYPNVVYSGTYGGGINAIYLNSTGEFDSIKYITTNEGLPNNTIFGMLADKEGNIWASTNLGICQFNPEKNIYHIYDKNDGLQDNNFLRAIWAKDGDNLLFGGASGFNIFDPLNIGEDKTPPMLVFTGFEIDGKKVEVGKEFNKRVILKQNLDKTDKLVLTYKEKTFTITFSALHYAFPFNNKYRYMLQGFDDDWLEVSSNIRRVSYSNLKPGNYTLKVLASNYDDVYMENPREIKIKVKTPWWRTILFYIILVVAVILSILNFIRQRDKQAKKDNEKLQKQIEEGEAVIAEKMKQVEQHQEEIKLRDEQEKEIRYFTEGIARFSDILAQKSDDVDQLTRNIISELVKYVGGCLGGIFLLNDDDKTLELKGAFATDTSKMENNRFAIGEGYIGTCFKEEKTIILENVPDDYTQLTSGLGKGKPERFYFVPLKQNLDIEGVIEVASFNPIEQYKIDFIEKVAENVTSTITIQKAKTEADKLVQQSKVQASQLHEQEEEMRQNLEELQATQEESQRKDIEKDNIINELRIDSVLLRSILDKFPDIVYFKDVEGKYTHVSTSMLSIVPNTTIEAIKGKTDVDIYAENFGQKYFDEDMDIIKTGKGFVDKVIKEQLENGKERMVFNTKLPLFDAGNKCIGIFGMSSEVSKLKDLGELLKKYEDG